MCAEAGRAVLLCRLSIGGVGAGDVSEGGSVDKRTVFNEACDGAARGGGVATRMWGLCGRIFVMSRCGGGVDGGSVAVSGVAIFGYSVYSLPFRGCFIQS